MASPDPLQKLSAALSLPDEAQDWGIINADAARIEEFIDYYERSPLVHPQHVHLAELIIASMNDLLVSGTAPETLVLRFRRFVTAHRSEFAVVFDYWARMSGNIEMPVTALLG